MRELPHYGTRSEATVRSTTQLTLTKRNDKLRGKSACSADEVYRAIVRISGMCSRRQLVSQINTSQISNDHYPFLFPDVRPVRCTHTPRLSYPLAVCVHADNSSDKFTPLKLFDIWYLVFGIYEI